MLTYSPEVAKDGNADVTTRVQAAGDAVGDKFDQHKHEVRFTHTFSPSDGCLQGKQTKADVHKEAAKH